MSKLDITKPVQLSDGRKAEILCTDFNYPHRDEGLILVRADDFNDSRYDDIYYFTQEGFALFEAGAALINTPPEPQYVWLNIIKRGERLEIDSSDYTLNDSKGHEWADCVGRRKVKLEEGRWDE